MQKIDHIMHHVPGLETKPIVAIPCPHEGMPIPADHCDRKWCTANRGVKKRFDDDGKVVEWSTLCAMEDIVNE